jgi:hypothetical protein
MAKPDSQLQLAPVLAHHFKPRMLAKESPVNDEAIRLLVSIEHEWDKQLDFRPEASQIPPRCCPGRWAGTVRRRG